MKKLIVEKQKEGLTISKALENKRKGGLVFSHVFVSKIVKNKAYVAKFNYSFKANSMNLNPFETSIGGNSESECIEKTEKFLNTKIFHIPLEELIYAFSSGFIATLFYPYVFSFRYISF